jgi:cytochrome c oxidase cbb3-type subunit 4
MDINDLRSIVTVVGLLCFLAIVAWAYGRGSKKGFEEAANCRSPG